MTIDVTALEAFAADLARNQAQLDQQARQTVSKGALNIKNDWRANAAATAGRHARHYPRTIGYDLTTAPGVGSEAVIGPDKDELQGPLGNLLEFGTSQQGGHNDGGRALQAEEPRFLEAVRLLGGDLL